ncbi:MAG TPA: non-homologous end-joining DNA ligase [Rudaea sp.]|nr:non-homologous end-joining DNA ligase [Rudaea sp.]
MASQGTEGGKMKTGGSAPREKPAGNAFGAIVLSHPERVVFPADGFSKRDVACYYAAVMPWLLPHVSHRPLSIVRCPEGIDAGCFFQKHPADGFRHVHSVRLKEEGGSIQAYFHADDADGVLELVQYNALELHPWAATVQDTGHAQYIVFDLDPAPNVGWSRVAAAAIDVRELLDGLGLKSFVRTTGGKGLHVVVPLRPAAGWDQAKEFAHALALNLAASRPDEFVAVASKDRRDGKIFVDYLRNARGATSIASYSLRARAGAPVAVPLRWSELASLPGGDAFTIRNVPQRLERLRADPWAGFASLRQRLDRAGRPGGAARPRRAGS